MGTLADLSLDKKYSWAIPYKIRSYTSKSYQADSVKGWRVDPEEWLIFQEKDRHGYLVRTAEIVDTIPRISGREELFCSSLATWNARSYRASPQPGRNLLNSLFLFQNTERPVLLSQFSCHQDLPVPMGFCNHTVSKPKEKKPSVSVMRYFKKLPVSLHKSAALHPALPPLQAPPAALPAPSSAPIPTHKVWHHLLTPRDTHRVQSKLSAAHIDPCPYCVGQYKGKSHFHGMPGRYSQILSVFVHISE